MNYPPYDPRPYMPPYPAPQPYPPRMDAYIQPQQQTALSGPQTPSQGLSNTSRPVTSREEAMGVAADFSGAPMIFPDITHDRVYIKRWNFNTGAADFAEYVRIMPQPPQEQPQPPEPRFATVHDLDGLKGDLDRLRDEFERMRQRPQSKAVKKSEPSDE